MASNEQRRLAARQLRLVIAGARVRRHRLFSTIISAQISHREIPQRITRGRHMKSTVGKRSIVVGGHKTSVSLEDAFWNGLKEIASNRKLTLSKLVDAIDSNREHGNLSSALRLFVLDHYRTMIGSVASSRGSVAETATISATP